MSAATMTERRVELAGLRAQVEQMRRAPFALSRWETDRLDVLAFGEQRRLDLAANRRAWARELPRLAARVRRMNEPAMIASMGVHAAVQHWAGPLGFENLLTGDGRLIASDSLDWATLPLPLRYAAQDFGGHDGAVVVGRIDSIERQPGGAIFARGVIDLGSDVGREVARLIAGGYLGGISLDLDNTEVEPGSMHDGSPATVVKDGRVRAATIVSVPAFAEARIALVGKPTADLALYSAAPNPHDEGEDCGCTELSTAGPVSFTPHTTARTGASHDHH